MPLPKPVARPPGFITAQRLVFAALLVLNLGLRLAVVARPFPAVDDLLLPDDTYISLSLARNIADGHGPLAGLKLTNGFQPLYVFLVVPAFWLWPHDEVAPVRAALVLLSLFDTLTLWLLLGWIRKLTSSWHVAAVAGVAWALSSYVMRSALNGLETMLSVCLLVATLRAFGELMESSKTPWRPELRRAIHVGLLLGLAIFARIDNVLLAGILIVLIGGRLWRAKLLQQAAGRSAAIAIVALPAIVNAPWALYCLVRMGVLLPVSGEAVRFQAQSKPGVDTIHQGAAVRSAWLAVTAVWGHSYELIIGTVVLLVVAIVLRRRSPPEIDSPRRWTNVAVGLYAAALMAFYIGYVPVAWYYARYLFPATIGLLLVFSYSLRGASEGLRRWIPPAVTTSIAAVGMAVSLVMDSNFKPLYTSENTNSHGYMNIGVWAESHFPAGTRIGAHQSGAISYFARDLVVINLDGVVNHDAFVALQARRMLDYARSVQVKFLVNWPVDMEYFLKHSEGASYDDAPIETRVEGFLSWKKPWLVARVR